MNCLTLRSMAIHEASTETEPKSAVRNTKSALIPSTPSAKVMLSAGTHGCFSTNCISELPVLKPDSIAMASATSSKVKPSAAHRTASSLRRSITTAAPAAGTKTIRLSSGNAITPPTATRRQKQ